MGNVGQSVIIANRQLEELEELAAILQWEPEVVLAAAVRQYLARQRRPARVSMAATLPMLLLALGQVPLG